ncbi:hypothetical protein [Serratia liquefaciens]|uniref:hypothetical protein n=1 Tax=Serratia liquefaciens TaxID=614 RepID=UPI0039AFFC83
MASIIMNGRQIFILTENDRFPSRNINSPTMFAIREDDDHQHWVYTNHDHPWALAIEEPFSTQESALEAAINFKY